jgi:hypothetical protein
MDFLKIIDNLRRNLFEKYGNPLATYKKTQDDVHMTYYVGRLMKELGHAYIMPEEIRCDHEDRVYYSEKAIHDAFLAGRLIERKDRAEMKKELIAELKHDLHHLIDNEF